MKLDQELQKALTIKFTIALAIIVILASIGFAILQSAIKQLELDAKNINVSGNQHRLSQQIALYSEYIYNSENRLRFDLAKNDLKTAIANFKKGHIKIEQSENSKNIEDILYNEPINLNQRIIQYISIAEQISQSNFSNRKQILLQLEMVRDQANFHLINDLGDLVFAYQTERAEIL